MLPTTLEAATAIVHEMQKAGLLSREKLLEMANETGDQTRAIVETTNRETQHSRILSFAETDAFLREHGVDLKLGEAREDDVRKMIRWGALDIKYADKYGANFDSVKMPEHDLQELVKRIKAKPDIEQRVVFGVDDITPEQGFQKLFDEAGIPYHIQLRPGLDRKFSRYQRIDAKTQQPLKNQLPTGKAGILFTPNHLNLPVNSRRISPYQQLVKMANGQKYVGPLGWMKLFRQSIDRALPILFPEEAANLDNLKPEQYKALVQKALLDTRIDKYLPPGTQFSDLSHEDDGVVPYLIFISNRANRYVRLDWCHDNNKPSDCLGGHDALGTFLS